MDHLPDSAVFEVAFAATLASFSLDHPEPRTPPEQDRLDRAALRAMVALGRAEGPAAVARCQREIRLYLALEMKETEERRHLLELLTPLLEGHPDMTLGEALAIFNARGGQAH